MRLLQRLKLRPTHAAVLGTIKYVLVNNNMPCLKDFLCIIQSEIDFISHFLVNKNIFL
jgi:hypothetical protein